MEKAIKTIKTYKSVPITKNISVYVSRDGQEHRTEKECVTHEKQLDYMDKFNTIKRVEFSDRFFPDTWFYASNEEELDMIKDNLYYEDSYNYIEINGVSKKNFNLQVGDWIAMDYHDGGDDRGTRYFYTLSYLKENISKFLSKFN